MFERYTEKARRTIFFAPYEAEKLGSSFIEPEHLLLGLLRECSAVRNLLPRDAVGQIRRKLQQLSENQDQIRPAADMPLSAPAKRSLALAAEEAARLEQAHIGCGHLFSGLLLLEPARVHVLLREHGGDLKELREAIRRHLGAKDELPETSVQPTQELAEDWLLQAGKASPVPEFAAVHQALWRVLSNAYEHMDRHTDAYGNVRLHRLPWTRKQALAYLIDLASQHRIWLLRALTEPNLRADRVPSEETAAAQSYETVQWQFLVECWLNAYCLLLHTISALPGTKAALPCRIGIAAPITLQRLLESFLETTEDVIEQVSARLD